MRPSTKMIALQAGGLGLLLPWAVAFKLLSTPVEHPIAIESYALAGGDVAAAVWSERDLGGQVSLSLAVAGGRNLLPVRELPLAGSDEFKLVDAGPGRVVLQMARPSRSRIDF